MLNLATSIATLQRNQGNLGLQMAERSWTTLADMTTKLDSSLARNSLTDSSVGSATSATAESITIAAGAIAAKSIAAIRPGRSWH